jgi:hypothetical protein
VRADVDGDPATAVEWRTSFQVQNMSVKTAYAVQHRLRFVHVPVAILPLHLPRKEMFPFNS